MNNIRCQPAARRAEWDAAQGHVEKSPNENGMF
jgi:hypothetical protein